MLEVEFKFFREHQNELYRKFPHKYLVIKDEKVVCAEATFEEALKSAINQGLELGTFLIQLCGESEKSYTQSFHAGVIFA